MYGMISRSARSTADVDDPVGRFTPWPPSCAWADTTPSCRSRLAPARCATA